MSTSKKDLVQISSYSRRLKENVRSILDNYGEIMKAAKVQVEASALPRVSEAQMAHVENEVGVRAANIVRAAEALSKLVSDLREYLLLNDFPSVNVSMSQRVSEFEELTAKKKKALEESYARAASVAAGGGVPAAVNGGATTTAPGGDQGVGGNGGARLGLGGDASRTSVASSGHVQ